MPAKVTTQADQRRDINPKDQFGRKWLMTIEKVTGDPTGGAVPAGFTDVLRTPQHYIRTTRNEDGQIELGRVVVDFAAWLNEVEEEERAWYEQLHRNALHVYKAVDPTEVHRLDQDKFLLDLTGPKPFPSSEVLKAAMNGEPGYLGLAPLSQEQRAALRMPTLADLKQTTTPAKVAAPASQDDTPPDTYPAFVSWCFRKGTVQAGDLKAAAALWKEHRANLAAA